MVEMELKRDRIVIRLGTKKWEWVLEPRYWRNTLLWAASSFHCSHRVPTLSAPA